MHTEALQYLSEWVRYYALLSIPIMFFISLEFLLV
jgi:hypothetical protein